MRQKLTRFERVAIPVVLLASLFALAVGVYASLPASEDLADAAAGEATTTTPPDTTSLQPTILEPDMDDTVLGPVITLPVIYVNPNGDDSRDGRTPETAKRTLDAAVAIAAPGDEVILSPGTFPGASVVREIHGTAAAPIVIRGAGDASILDAQTFDRRDTLRITRSSHLRFEDLTITSGIHGTFVVSSNHVTFDRVTWRDVGQEGVQIDGTSSNLLFQNCVVTRTGLRGGRFAQYGEGIYIGSSRSDAPVQNVTVRNCSISDTTAEAVDIKPGVSGILIENNEIFDIDTWNSGAVVAYLGATYDAQFAADFDPDITIRSNRIWNVSRTSQWADGNAIALNAPAEVYNNVMYDLQHRGVIVERDFRDNTNKIEIYNNTIHRVGLTPVEIRSGDEGIILTNNIGVSAPGNLQASDDLFVDSANGDFRLVAGSPAIDAASGLVSSTDINGESRSVAGSSPDYGAYEYIPPGTPAQPGTDSSPDAPPVIETPASQADDAPASQGGGSPTTSEVAVVVPSQGDADGLPPITLEDRQTIATSTTIAPSSTTAPAGAAPSTTTAASGEAATDGQAGSTSTPGAVTPTSQVTSPSPSTSAASDDTPAASTTTGQPTPDESIDPNSSDASEDEPKTVTDENVTPADEAADDVPSTTASPSDEAGDETEAAINDEPNMSLTSDSGSSGAMGWVPTVGGIGIFLSGGWLFLRSRRQIL